MAEAHLRRTALDRLRARARACLAVAFAGWIVFIACLLIPTLPFALMFAAFLTVPAAILTLILTLRCPACRARIPQVGLVAAWQRDAAQARRCPACRADLVESNGFGARAE